MNSLFEIKSIKAVKKDMKKLSQEVLRDIETIHFKNIRENPFQSEELGYSFSGIRSYHFKHKVASYRIIYEIFEEDELIIVIMIGPREGFYERLKRRII